MQINFYRDFYVQVYKNIHKLYTVIILSSAITSVLWFKAFQISAILLLDIVLLNWPFVDIASTRGDGEFVYSSKSIGNSFAIG